MVDWKQSYRHAFRNHALQLIAWGHSDCRGAVHRLLEEEEITQLLVTAMRERLARLDLPDEFDYLDVDEDQPHSSDQRTGKRRRRIDIVITKVQRGRRPTYSIEAKRLGAHSGSLAAYMGADGLGLFVSEAYAADQSDAAMLGYVQKGAPADWAAKVRSFIAKNPARVSAVNASEPIYIVPDLQDTCRSRHSRPSLGPIDLLHIFLDCC